MCKYSTDVQAIKERIKKARIKSGYTQKELAEALYVGDAKGRTTVTNWESEKLGLPSLINFINLCNVLNVDMNYLLCASDIESKDYKTIADTVHISEATVHALKNNHQYGSILDSMVSYDLLSKNNLFAEISYRIKQLGQNLVLEDVINTSFKSKFISVIRQIFSDFYFSTFPMDLSAELFTEYLTKRLPYSNAFFPNNFMDQNFLCEGKNFIYNRYENGKEEFDNLESPEKYKVIISSIAEISYGYFISLQTVELSKQRISSMLTDIINNAIKQETEKAKANLAVKAYTTHID